MQVEDTFGALDDLIPAGTVRHVGMSETAPQRTRRAQAVIPITALQIQYSL